MSQLPEAHALNSMVHGVLPQDLPRGYCEKLAHVLTLLSRIRFCRVSACIARVRIVADWLTMVI